MQESLVILFSVMQAIGTSGSLAVAGILITRQGIISDSSRKSLAELSMNLLMPCLLFTSMVNCPPGSDCAPVSEIIGEAWILLIMPLFVVGSGMALGRLVSMVTPCPKNFNKACVGAVAFANSTGMSITLLEVLGPTLLREGVLDKNPLKILPVYLLLYPMLQWTCGSYLFGLTGQHKPEAEKPPASNAAPPTNIQPAAQAEEDPSSPLSFVQTLTLRRATRSLKTLHDLGESVAHALTLPALDLAADPDFYPPEQPSRSRAASADCRRDIEAGTMCAASNEVAKSSPSIPTESTKASSQASAELAGQDTGCDRCCAALRGKLATVRKVIRNALVPPVIGSALGLLVALVRPAQALFVDISGGGSAAPLSFLFQGMVMIGQASVPINMLVLGSNLSKGCDFKAVPLSTNFGILFMKNLGQPLMLTALIAGLSRLISNDTSIWLVALIVSCTPTANNIMVMVELSGQNKAGVTACIFTQYIAAPFVLSLVISGYLLMQPWLVPQ